MRVTYTWCMGTWHCESDEGHSEWLLHNVDDEEDPLRESLLEECRENDAFKEVSVERRDDGKVQSFVFESVD